MPTPEETRHGQRTVIQIPASFSVAPAMERDFTLAQKEITAAAVDLSPAGLGIVSPVYLPEKLLLHIELDANQIYPDKEKERIEFTGEVHSCHMVDGKYRIGILIKGMRTEDLQAIRKFLTTSSS